MAAASAKKVEPNGSVILDKEVEHTKEENH